MAPSANTKIPRFFFFNDAWSGHGFWRKAPHDKLDWNETSNLLTVLGFFYHILQAAARALITTFAKHALEKMGTGLLVSTCQRSILQNSLMFKT